LELYNQDCLLLDPLAKFQVERFGIVLVEGFFDVAAMIEAFAQGDLKKAQQLHYKLLPLIVVTEIQIDIKRR